MGDTTFWWSIRYPFDHETIASSQIANAAADMATTLDTIDAAKLQAIKRPSVGLRASVATSAAPNTETDLVWASEDFDTDGLANSGVSTTRITIPAGQGGVYLVIVHIPTNSASNWSSGQIAIRKNGTTVFRRKIWGAASPQLVTAQFIQAQLALVPTDFVTGTILFQGLPNPSSAQNCLIQAQRLTT